MVDILAAWKVIGLLLGCVLEVGNVLSGLNELCCTLAKLAYADEVIETRGAGEGDKDRG